MAQTLSTELAGINSLPVVKPAVPAYGGRLRRYRASITYAAQAAADTVVLAKLPAGQAFAYGVIVADTSSGSTTIAVGNATTAALYKAAAAFTTTDTPTLFGKAAAVIAAAYSAEETVLLTWAAATAPGSGNLCIDIYTSQA